VDQILLKENCISTDNFAAFAGVQMLCDREVQHLEDLISGVGINPIAYRKSLR